MYVLRDYDGNKPYVLLPSAILLPFSFQGYIYHKLQKVSIVQPTKHSLVIVFSFPFFLLYFFSLCLFFLTQIIR